MDYRVLAKEIEREHGKSSGSGGFGN
jgi:hypothetical protein